MLFTFKALRGEVGSAFHTMPPATAHDDVRETRIDEAHWLLYPLASRR